MRMKDYYRLGWDQLKRRKVVTALCAMGIAIGSASIIVALSFGESITHYSEQQMGHWLKMDEVTITSGYVEDENGERREVAMNDQMLDIIRTLPGVEAAAPWTQMEYYSFRVDQTRRGGVDLIATDLSTLPDFGYELRQGSVSDSVDTVILNYAATLELYDERASALEQTAEPMPRDDLLISYPLYQKTIELTKHIANADGSVRTVVYPLRVIGVLAKPEGLPDYMLRYPKEAYVSMETAKRIRDVYLAAGDPNARRDAVGYEVTKLKVPDLARIPAIEEVVRMLKLESQSNMFRQDQMGQEMMIVRLVFGGVGLFILCVASLTIIVAMTMATHQRRRQIGIMKVLGANLAQIRNMFIVESSLLGLLGGMLGILLSYWVIWAINIVVIRFSGGGSDSEILFISFWVLPVGLFFALLTGILSGLYPAVKASRTDALTAIKRE